MPSLQDLKPVQLKELTEAFAAMDASGQAGGTGRPTRFTRKQAREMEAAAGAGMGGAEDADAEPGKLARFMDRGRSLRLMAPTPQKRRRWMLWIC